MNDPVKKEIKVEISVTYYRIRIIINNIIHLSLPIDPAPTMQSYKDNNGSYFIEYSTGTGIIKCGYERRELWEEILKQLADKKIF